MRIVMTLLYLAGFIAISSATAAQESTAELLNDDIPSDW